MKLVRLCSSNDGVFTSNFGNDMILEENSKMALLNLTFESDIGQIIISNDMSITTQTDNNNDGTFSVKFLDSNKFANTQEGYDRFVAVVEGDLNETFGLGRGIDALENSTGCQYRIVKNNSGQFNIILRYCPLTNPLAYHSDIGAGAYPELMDKAFSVTSTTRFDSGPPFTELTTLRMTDDEVARITNDANLISPSQISMGSGYMTARVANLIDNGSVLEDNGFAIGLTNIDLSTIGVNAGEEIPVANIFGEVRINRKEQTYRFRDTFFGNVEQESTTYPHRVAATPPVTGYLNLPLGNDWTQDPTPATERFDSLDLGPIATFRRVQDGGGSIHWWEATSATTWNIYTTKPLLSTDTPSNTATADLASGVLTNVTGGATFTPSGYGATPDIVNLPVNVNVHDVMGFEIFGNNLYICVYRDLPAPNNRVVLSKTTIPPGTKLYPYLYINGSKDHLKIDMFNFTANTLETIDSDNVEFALKGESRQGGWGPDEDNNFYFTRDKGMYNGQQTLQLDAAATNIQSVLPSVYWKDSSEDQRFGNVNAAEGGIPMTLKMPKRILKYLGFENMEGEGNHTFTDLFIRGVWTTAQYARGLPFIYNSDNFIVESTNLRLDSYDASKVQYNTQPGAKPFSVNAELSGRRKNILMTIPTNDNTNGLVEYETNTPIFIDIGNAEKINVKNLNLRVLRKDFSPIKQGESLAIMTLLIDN
tara:strand:+ start:2972 stop:5089 length:2118 start_codon:yes stop_codon:yes gene_type:complete